VLLCWITGEPLQWRDEQLSMHREAFDVLQLLHRGDEGAFVEAREVVSRQQLAEHFSGDTRYARLEALEDRIEPTPRARAIA
jgi:hypothetical protein